jgi:hypothetical protein
MQQAGYIRLYRRLLTNPVWTELAPAVAKVFITVLLKANFKESDWYDGRRQVHIPRGAFITSYRKIAEECNLSVQQVRDAFLHLKRTRMATCTGTHHWTLVNVCNYDRYQVVEGVGEHTVEHAGEHVGEHTVEQQRKKKEIISVATWPRAREAFEHFFPENADFLPKLIETAITAKANVSDEELGEAIYRCHIAGKQRGPGLFLKTIPQFLKNGRAPMQPGRAPSLAEELLRSVKSL